ncbi:unnamed protein product [Mesocestoides corti]|uniref:L-lactate dehydrogenase n=2 Tax=Mesocestoides corti TaxID=53468 RepID=A0A0R3U9F2_MESCO|nr:unnamed protein product [Mesocestoides corti]
MSDSALFMPLERGPSNVHNTKISVVGVGSVGMAAAFAIMLKSVSDTLVLYDIVEDKCNGEVMDLEQSSQYIESCNVVGGTDITKTANSDIVVITAGARQAVGESRLNLVQRNVDIFKNLIPALVEQSPNSILVVVSNPVDVMTYVTWKLSGFPKNRVLGSGTMLDTARFRHILGRKLNVNSSSVHGYIVGEHGDSSVPVWSKVTIGGLNLLEAYPKLGQSDDPDDFQAVHKAVVASAYDIIRMKGYTSWAIGVCCANLCNAILRNRGVVLPVTTCVEGRFGVKDSMFTSVPCVVDSMGVSSMVNLNLSAAEEKLLVASINTLRQTISGIRW